MSTKSNYFEIPELYYDAPAILKMLLVLDNDKTSSWGKYGNSNPLYSTYVNMNSPTILNIIHQFQNYNLLIENIKFLKTLRCSKVVAHKDIRNVAINIPVKVNSKNKINFYKEQNNFKYSYLTVNGEIKGKNYKVYNDDKKLLIESFSNINKNAVCLNTNIIHSIENNTDSDRVVLSISFKKKYDDFLQISKMYKSGELLC